MWLPCVCACVCVYMCVSGFKSWQEKSVATSDHGRVRMPAYDSLLLRSRRPSLCAVLLTAQPVCRRRTVETIA